MKIHFLSAAFALAFDAILSYADPIQTVYQTDFENPPFILGPLAGQNGWEVFGQVGLVNVIVQGSIVKSGAQAMEIDTSGRGSGAGRIDASSLFSTVAMQADVYLQNSSRPTPWEFAAQDNGVFGGFTVLSDGVLRIAAPGSPITSPVITRDSWNHYEVDYNFVAQNFNVLINGNLVAANQRFLISQTRFVTGVIFSFGTGASEGGNDKAFVDNYNITETTPEPYSALLAIVGLIAIAFVRRVHHDF